MKVPQKILRRRNALLLVQHPARQSIGSESPRRYEKTSRAAGGGILTWFDEHTEDRLKLFSDSKNDAKAEGRDIVSAGKSKTYYYGKIAQDIFKDDHDPNVRREFSGKKGAYQKSIQNKVAQ